MHEEFPGFRRVRSTGPHGPRLAPAIATGNARSLRAAGTWHVNAPCGRARDGSSSASQAQSQGRSSDHGWNYKPEGVAGDSQERTERGAASLPRPSLLPSPETIPRGRAFHTGQTRKGQACTRAQAGTQTHAGAFFPLPSHTSVSCPGTDVYGPSGHQAQLSVTAGGWGRRGRRDSPRSGGCQGAGAGQPPGKEAPRLPGRPGTALLLSRPPRPRACSPGRPGLRSPGQRGTGPRAGRARGTGPAAAAGLLLPRV